MDDKYLKEIESCVEKSMEAEEFSKMKIDFTRKNTTEQGILADLIFATVSGTDRDNKYKEVNLALKLGKRNEALREGAPVLIECYKRELFFYDTVLPAFHRFQVERNISNIFDALPKCYGTVLSDDIEALVLEDLKRKAFVLHDQQIGMNLQHLQLVLKNYAKFHALSFAFRVQHHQKFNKLAANYHSVLKKLFLMWIGGPQDEKVRMVLREAGREDLNEKYTEETKNNELTTLLAILDDVPQESVITHGDCHNDNLLFEYKLIAILYLATICVWNYASPLPDISSTDLRSSNDNGISNANTHPLIKNPLDEDLETAEMIIFRPLFTYRKTQAQKYRIKGQEVRRGYYY